MHNISISYYLYIKHRRTQSHLICLPMPTPIHTDMFVDNAFYDHCIYNIFILSQNSCKRFDAIFWVFVSRQFHLNFVHTNHNYSCFLVDFNNIIAFIAGTFSTARYASGGGRRLQLTSLRCQRESAVTGESCSCCCSF